ncbi:MAG TPA: GspH/FimT family pseudopilin [Lysobacter sp.]
MRGSSRGFTLVELMVTLAVAAILLALATPSLAELLRRNRIAAANNELVTALNVARAEALRRGRPVTVCASADQRSCAASTNWATGWVVFEDSVNAGAPAGPAARAADYDNRMISVSPAAAADFSLTGADQWYRYAPTGSLSWNTVGGGSERSFLLRNSTCTGNQARRITVNRIGRIRSAAEACQ